MVRGLRPRNCIRWAVNGGGRAVGNAGAIGHAERLRLTHPGNPTTTGRRGRRPLRAVAKRKNQHHGKQMRHRRKLPPTPLGSPERGAVAPRSGVTEGLAQRWCGETTLPINRRRAGMEARPYEAWGGGRDAITLSVDRRRGERGDGVDAWNRRRRSIDGRRTGDGAPYDVWGTLPHCNYDVRHPTEGASGTPPPTGCAIGYVSAEP